RAFRAPPREKGRNIKAFSGPSPPQGDSVNKAELTAALAMRTKMSKADATRTIDALFDDKGIIAGELKKGAKGQITGFGDFEPRHGTAPLDRHSGEIPNDPLRHRRRHVDQAERLPQLDATDRFLLDSDFAKQRAHEVLGCRPVLLPHIHEHLRPGRSAARGRL